MNAEIKKKWIAALRSGKYQQDQGRLRTKNGYCCLGVLSDLYIKETGLGEWRESRDHEAGDFYFVAGETKPTGTMPGDESYAYLVKAVREWADVERNGGSCPLSTPIKNTHSKGESHEIQSLAGANDLGFTFEEIAQIIEEQL